jgi:hypothetical protein
MTLAPHSRADGGQQLVARLRFLNITVRPGSQPPLHNRGIVVHGHKDDAGSRMPTQYFVRGPDTIEARHPDVRHDHVGRQRVRSLDQRLTVLNRSHDFAFPLQQVSEERGIVRVIIRQQYSCSSHDRLAFLSEAILEECRKHDQRKTTQRGVRKNTYGA